MTYQYAHRNRHLTMSIDDAAELINIAPDTIRAAVRRGEDVGFPVIRAGRAYRVPRRPLMQVLGIQEQK